MGGAFKRMRAILSAGQGGRIDFRAAPAQQGFFTGKRWIEARRIPEFRLD